MNGKQVRNLRGSSFSNDSHTLKIIMTQEKTCSICKIPIVENYCVRCGQSFTGKKTSIISLIIDFISNFLSMEKSGFATILKILKNPKPIVDNYYFGFKNYYASPGKVLLYGIAVIALHVGFVDDKVMGLSINVINMKTQYFFWLQLFPVLLFVSYISFIRIERSLSKQLISLIYVASSLFIALTILNDLLIIIWSDLLGIWAFIIAISLIFFWNSRVFTIKKRNIYIILNTLIQLAIFTGIAVALIMITNNLNSR